jgi:NADPH:quinone reductase-like Zn-dependent oxidoreductase
MLATALNRFGGIEELAIRRLPLPHVGPDEVLIQVEAAGLGSWESGEREGRYADYLGKADDVSHIPGELTFEGAAVLGWDALTALAGLEDTLQLRQ